MHSPCPFGKRYGLTGSWCGPCPPSSVRALPGQPPDRIQRAGNAPTYHNRPRRATRTVPGYRLRVGRRRSAGSRVPMPRSGPPGRRRVRFPDGNLNGLAGPDRLDGPAISPVRRRTMDESVDSRTTTPTLQRPRFTWSGRLSSVVTRTSFSPRSARYSNPPLPFPDQFFSASVFTECPGRCPCNGAGVP